jgi:hypothetical protein
MKKRTDGHLFPNRICPKSKLTNNRKSTTSNRTHSTNISWNTLAEVELSCRPRKKDCEPSLPPALDIKQVFHFEISFGDDASVRNEVGRYEITGSADDE